TDAQAYPGLKIEDARPVSALRTVAHSPLLTLFYFVPKSLWISIGIETNRYGLQQVPRRGEVIRGKQPDGRRQTLKQIRRRLKSKRGYDTHEILHVVGLLIARMLCPQQRRFASHWSMVEDVAVLAGNLKLLTGWTLPSVFSFDEGVFPATSKRSPTRMFMPDKPHRYGSKLFMPCDSRSAYCHRFEMYAGKRRDTKAETVFDHNTGAATVVRNLKTVLGSSTRQPWHVDRYYSSILLAIELLSMHVYVIGTIRTNRLGYDQRVKKHSQQMSTKFKKYYKSLFLGLLDLALVNAYISHKESARISGTVAIKRGEWYIVLHNQLLQLKAENFLGVEVTPPPSQKRKRTPLRATHALEQCDDWVTVSGTQKRRQRSCKVCALLRTNTKKKPFVTTFFCERCSIDDTKCWLCNKIRRYYKGVEKTCFEIWHDDFEGGDMQVQHLAYTHL
ncbi:hypothetical protein F443_13582, partial [Phytophthora nicotianae P1569]